MSLFDRVDNIMIFVFISNDSFSFLEFLSHQTLLFLDPLLSFALLDLPKKQFHVLVLAHPSQNIVAKIQKSHVRPQTATVELAELLIRANSPSADLHFAFVAYFFEVIVLLFAGKFPQFFVAVVILEATSCQFEGKLIDLEVQVEVKLIELLVKDSQFLNPQESIAILVQFFVSFRLLINFAIFSNIALIDIIKRPKLIIFLLLILIFLGQSSVNNMFLVCLDFGFMNFHTRLFQYPLFYIIKWSLLFE